MTPSPPANGGRGGQNLGTRGYKILERSLCEYPSVLESVGVKERYYHKLFSQKSSKVAGSFQI